MVTVCQANLYVLEKHTQVVFYNYFIQHDWI